jgi:NTE family protein
MNHFSNRRRQLLLAAVSAGLPLSQVAALVNERDPIDSVTQLAVCLGSGGKHGYAHIGAIRAFDRFGLKPDIVCGTSAGAIAGVLWAAGHGADTIEKIVNETDWYTQRLPRIPMLGIGKLDGLRELIDRHVGHRRIEALPTRFAAVATDLDTGQPVLLDEGPTGQAVAASASVPLRYEPVTVGGKRLVDGALSAPVPVDAAHAIGATFAVAVDVAYRPYEEPVSGISDVAFQTFHIMVNRLIEEQIKRADFAIRLDVHEVMRGDDVLSNVIRAGEGAIHQHWSELKRALSRVGFEAVGQ